MATHPIVPHMTTTAFISYSHADEKSLERLHKHLAMMKRDGSLRAWYDHEIMPGDRIDGLVSENLSSSQIFLALVSANFLDSQYCYEKEFREALKLEEAGRLQIVPIILEACDWLSSPLKQFKALPKDGKPISDWANQNNAFLDVVNGLRRIVDDHQPSTDDAIARGIPILRRQVKIKRQFDTIQKAEFADKAFATIKAYFEASCTELNRVGDDLRARFEPMSDSAFSCTVVNRALAHGGEASITVHNRQGNHPFGGDIVFAYARRADAGMSNGAIRVEADDYNMSLTADFLSYGSARNYTAEQAAEHLWVEFVRKAGIEYG